MYMQLLYGTSVTLHASSPGLSCGMTPAKGHMHGQFIQACACLLIVEWALTWHGLVA